MRVADIASKNAALDPQWQRLWFSLLTHPVTAIAVIETDASVYAERVAHILASVGDRNGRPPVQVVSAIGAQFSDVPGIVTELSKAASRGELVLVPCEPLRQNPATVPILRATSGAVLVVRLGGSLVASVKNTVAVLGRDGVLASIVIDELNSTDQERPTQRFIWKGLMSSLQESFWLARFPGRTRHWITSRHARWFRSHTDR